MLLLLQNGRSNQLYFTCGWVCLSFVAQDSVLSCFLRPVAVTVCLGGMLAVYTDKWAGLEETVKETLCVLTRNCVIIFCYDHLNRSSYGFSKICRKLERSTFNYELRVKFCFGARGRFIDGSTFCRYFDAFLWMYMAFQPWHPLPSSPSIACHNGDNKKPYDSFHQLYRDFIKEDEVG